MKKSKINISRQHIYLLSISIFLFLFVLIFSFVVLIPQGKEYRKSRVDLKMERRELRKYQNFNDETQEELDKLQKKHRAIIIAFDTKFNSKRFQKQHKKFFSSLEIAKLVEGEKEEGFASYEVNTTSKINSPKSFYDFLDAINKSDWIIGVDFPIEFKRDDNLIKSTFTMRVYSNSESNETKEKEEKEKK